MHTILMLVASTAQAADCDTQPTTSELTALTAKALTAYADMDQEGFEADADRAVTLVDCLTEPASPALAASIHRIRGIRLFLDGNNVGSAAALGAAAAIEPSFAVPDDIAPEGGKLWTAFEDARSRPAAPRTLVEAPGHTVIVDGIPVPDRPSAGPYIFQLKDPAGTLTMSAFLIDRAPDLLTPSPVGAPPVAAAPVDHRIAAAQAAMALQPVSGAPLRPASSSTVATTSSTATKSKSKSKKGGKGLLVAGLLSGGLGAGLYGTAAYTRLQYDSTPSSTSYSVTNGAYYGSIGAGALSGALLTTFLVTR